MRRLGAAIVVAACLVAAGAVSRWRAGEDLPGRPVASVRGALVERGVVAPEVQESLQRSVLLVHSSGCGSERQATATVLDEGGRSIGLTNQHVVAGSVDVSVEGLEDPVGVLGTVDGRDAARLDGDELAAGGARALATGPRPLLGAQVVVAGYPGGRFRAVTGHVRAIEARQGYGGSSDVLIVDVEAVPGVSGGVVLDVQGRAVGLVVARDPSSSDVVAYPLDVIGDGLRTQRGCS
ncbi:MAG: trypsin-like peptidase domain-containing protein [Actinobacteria bacterium]|nr:trypsin-like peptidase domain-containing protein [Actinomycetota bacterium]